MLEERTNGQLPDQLVGTGRSFETRRSFGARYIGHNCDSYCQMSDTPHSTIVRNPAAPYLSRDAWQRPHRRTSWTVPYADRCRQIRSWPNEFIETCTICTGDGQHSVRIGHEGSYRCMQVRHILCRARRREARCARVPERQSQTCVGCVPKLGRVQPGIAGGDVHHFS